MKAAIHIFLFCLAINALGGAPEAIKTGANSEVEAVRAAVHQFIGIWESRDLEATMDMFVTNDDIAIYFPNPYAPMRHDGQFNVRKAIGLFYDMIPSRARLSMTRHDPRTQVYGSVAVHYSYYTLNVMMGGTPATFRGRTTFMLRKEKGVWKILHIHSSEFPQESQYFDGKTP